MKIHAMAGLLLGAMLLGGCGGSTDGGSVSTSTESAYLSLAPLDGAQGVAAAREADNDGEQITIVGLIGGSEKPFVDNLAAFTIVDESVPHCSDEEGCPTPWDYCCETDKLPANSATIKIVDDNGKTLDRDAKALLGVAELSRITVRGTAKRDSAGNLTVNAQKIHVGEKAK
jgi:hypothetical protein